MKITTTRGAGLTRLSMLVYGPAGAGKTTLARTTGDIAGTVILSAEAGLLPLRDLDIRVIEIDSVETLEAALVAFERRQIAATWLILDSISEIAERVLIAAKKSAKDPRQAYGELSDRVIAATKRFRDLPIHTVFVAKQEQVQDDLGRLVQAPKFPGKGLSQSMPYEFDLVMRMCVERKDDVYSRWLQTRPDGRCDAKDRSGSLDAQEPPDLGRLAAKIMARTRPVESQAAPAPAPTAPAPTSAPLSDLPADVLRALTAFERDFPSLVDQAKALARQADAVVALRRMYREAQASPPKPAELVGKAFESTGHTLSDATPTEAA